MTPPLATPPRMTASDVGDALLAELLASGRRLGTLAHDGPVIVIDDAVLDEILEFSAGDLTRERGGFLLGQVLGEPPRGVLVRHFHPAREALEGSASLVFTHEAWAAVTRDLETNFPGDLLLGWQHTHPGFGVFLSGYDRFIHEHFFAQPWQIALVVDPRRQELGFFQWRGGAVQDCGFVCRTTG